MHYATKSSTSSLSWYWPVIRELFRSSEKLENIKRAEINGNCMIALKSVKHTIWVGKICKWEGFWYPKTSENASSKTAWPRLMNSFSAEKRIEIVRGLLDHPKLNPKTLEMIQDLKKYPARSAGECKGILIGFVAIQILCETRAKRRKKCWFGT